MVARALLLAPLAMAMSGTADPPGNAEPPGIMAPPAQGPGGLICAWAIYATMAEVGRRCPGARNASVDAALEQAVSHIEAYARRHSPPAAEMMARYRTQQIEGDAGICASEALRMHEHVVRTAPPDLVRQVDQLLASSPPVEWGACL